MQVDMHYYGVYALARAAGLKADHAETIAKASQFVDDNVEEAVVEFRDAARFSTVVTGHHSLNNRNLELDDQREVWVPFHFLPGNNGESYTERLVCGKDSDIAKKMVKSYIGMSDAAFIVELIGIAAHVYADTFAHYGFSGVSSRHNLVNQKKMVYSEKIDAEMSEYIEKKMHSFAVKYGDEHMMPNIKSWFRGAASRVGDLIEKTQGLFRDGALGHAGAYTLPDRPFLTWEYVTEYPDEKVVKRENSKDFLEGCEALHAMFSQLAIVREDLSAGDGRTFEDIKQAVEDILQLQAPMAKRIAAWQMAVKAGLIYNGGPELIPEYDPSEWHKNREGLKFAHRSEVAIVEPVFRFYQAASFHRHYVIRTLLPTYGLVVH